MQFRNNLPNGLDKDWKNILQMRDGVVVALALTVVFCLVSVFHTLLLKSCLLSAYAAYNAAWLQIAFLAATCDGLIVSNVFLCLSVIMALVAVGCSVEMREAYKKAAIDEVDLAFQAGFYLTIFCALTGLVGAITTVATSRSSTQFVFFQNPNAPRQEVS